MNSTDTDDNQFCYEGGYQKMFCFNSETFENDSFIEHALYVSIYKPYGKYCYIEIVHGSSAIATLLVYSDTSRTTAKDEDGWNVMPYKEYVNSTAPYHSERFYRIFNKVTKGNGDLPFSGNSCICINLLFGPQK